MTDRLADVPLSWPVMDSEVLYDGEWVVKIRRDTVHRPGHPEDAFGRLVVDDPGAVVILAIDDDDNVVCLRQYRHPVRMRLVELPAGKLDEPGEDPLLAAQRELREETGLAADDWTPLLTTYASPGITAEKHVMYLARGLREVDRDFDLHHEEVDMTVERVPWADLLDAIFEGRVADAPLITAVLAVESLRARGQIRPPVRNPD
ncbi:MAG: NUDIX hydrolase [Nocardioidaceae bacterium]|nr:NUDIX hydrolase [Nocardioidaceae bacterium]